MPPSSQITLDRLVMLIPSQGDGSIMLVSCLQVHVCASSSLRQLANTIFRILLGRISLNLQLQSTWDKDELIKFCGQKSKVRVMTRPNIDKKGHHVLATLLQSCCVVLKYVFSLLITVMITDCAIAVICIDCIIPVGSLWINENSVIRTLLWYCF